MGLATTGHFLGADARRELTAAVRAIEARSSVEIVVAVHPRSAAYAHVDLAVGLAAAMAWLCVFLYHPEPFDFTFLPLEMLGAFAAGALLSWALPPLKRALLRDRTIAREVERAAKTAFVDLGVTACRDRTGLLVFSTTFERRVQVVADSGVPKLAALDGLEARLARALRAGDVKAFAATLASLADAFAEALPRRHDDVNELPDEPLEAA